MYLVPVIFGENLCGLFQRCLTILEDGLGRIISSNLNGIGYQIQ